MNEALAEIWERTLPTLEGRIGEIEAAVAELRRPQPEGEVVERGRDAAHKLAGVLGTFGLGGSTELARQLERGLEAPGGDPAELAGLAAELRATVAAAGTESTG